jgi:hypothetical protein
MNTTSLEVAKIIQAQLLGISKAKVWSWGSHKWTVIENGLSFKCSGFLFTGVVSITLNPFDTYRIQFIKAKKVIDEYHDVYFDEMVDIIDNYVEYTGDNYKNDVANAVYTF